MSWSSQRILLGVDASLCLIFAIILIVLTYQYNKHKNHIAFKQRYANIVIIQSICVILKFVIDFAALFYGMFVDDNDNVFILWLSISESFSTLMGWLLCWRFWMLKYRICFQNDLANDKWQNIINSDDDINSWYIEKQETFGNS